MNGKRYATKDKIRILRGADRGERTIQAICQEANLSEVMFHRWKQFGHTEVNAARPAEGTGTGEHRAEEDAGGGVAQEPGVVIRMRKKL
jgi:transposase-like protein